jgi:hypothetical protein
MLVGDGAAAARLGCQHMAEQADDKENDGDRLLPAHCCGRRWHLVA